MDEKRRQVMRSKRASKVLDEGTWDCSVCTYRNKQEAFKCEMCDVRKGTSTRKPRLNPQLVAQQVAQQFTPPVKKEKTTPTSTKSKDKVSSTNTTPSGTQTKKRIPRLRNVDRSSASTMEVTVNNVTVVFTDYKLKEKPSGTSSSQSAGSPGTEAGHSSSFTSGRTPSSPLSPALSEQLDSSDTLNSTKGDLNGSLNSSNSSTS